AIDEAGSLPERRRGAEEESLLAAKPPAFVLHEGGNVVVGHAGADLLQQPLENLVLHRRRLADEISLFLALDCLEAIDEFGRIHERRLAGYLAFDTRDKSVRHGATADPPNGAIAALLELLGDELRLVFIAVGDAGEGRGEDHLAHAAVGLIA